jgi:hypothetical protein
MAKSSAATEPVRASFLREVGMAFPFIRERGRSPSSASDVLRQENPTTEQN